MNLSVHFCPSQPGVSTQWALLSPLGRPCSVSQLGVQAPHFPCPRAVQSHPQVCRQLWLGAGCTQLSVLPLGRVDGFRNVTMSNRLLFP